MSIFLVKYVDRKRYAIDLLDGKIFANRLSWFREMEQSDGSGRGDRHEGAVGWHQPDIASLTIGGVDMSPYIDQPIATHLGRLDNLNLFCTTYGAIEDEVLAGLSGDDDPEELTTLLPVHERCLRLGRYAVVIKDVGEFIRRVREAATAEGFVVGQDQVAYYDPGTYHGFTPLAAAVFRKHEGYSYQSEFRFAIHTGTEGDNHITLEIGDIRDIALMFHIKTPDLSTEGGAYLVQEATNESPAIGLLRRSWGGNSPNVECG